MTANPGRAGLLLPLALLFLLVAGLLAFATAYFKEHVFDKVRRLSLGIQAQTLAESAVEEAIHQVASGVNASSGDPFYKLFRERLPLAKSATPIDLEVSPDRLAVTRGLMAATGEYALDGDAVRVRVETHVAFSPDLAYERAGLITFSATVRDARGATGRDERFAQRTYMRTLEFRCQLLSPPRPFDRFQLFLEKPDAHINDNALSVGGFAPPNANISIDVQISALEQMKRDLERLPQDIEASAAADDIGAMMGLIAGAHDEVPDAMRLTIQSSAAGDRELIHAFRYPHVSFIRTDRPIPDETVALVLDLPRKAAVLHQEVFDLEAPYSTGISQTQSGMFGITVDQVRDAMDAARKLGKKRRELLELYKTFEDALVELTGAKELDLFAPLLAKLDVPFWTAAPAGSPVRATWIVEGAGELPAFLAKQRAISPVINGVIWIRDTPASELALAQSGASGGAAQSLKLAGRLVLVADGNVTMNGLEVADRNKHVLTVLAGGAVALAGKIEATVIATHGAVFGRTALAGALVLRKGCFPIEPDEAAPPVEVSLLRNAAQESSEVQQDAQREFASHVRVLFGPAPAAAAVFRGVPPQ